MCSIYTKSTPNKAHTWRMPGGNLATKKHTHLRPFGCKAYFHVPRPLHHKLDPTAKQGIMVGYEDPGYGYRIWNEEQKRVFVTTYCSMKIISLAKCKKKVTNLVLKVHT